MLGQLFVVFPPTIFFTTKLYIGYDYTNIFKIFQFHTVFKNNCKIVYSILSLK